MRLKEIGEFGLISLIERTIGENSSSELIRGIGDDCAVFQVSGGKPLLLTTDVLVEGVHFNLDYFSFHDLGRRAMACNLSDIAAMGGSPRYAAVTVGLEPETKVEAVEELYRGMSELAEGFQTAIIGGDTTCSSQMFVSLTLVGEADEGKPLLRSGAQIGDALFVTGDIGRARAGFEVLTRRRESQHAASDAVLKHKSPTPRVDEGRFLAKHFDIHAMIDISDGLASEVYHLCEANGTGAVIFETEIPIHEVTQHVAGMFSESALDYALSGGEDFELLFAAPANLQQKLEQALKDQFACNCTRIGEITAASKGIFLERTNGFREALPCTRYDHFPR